MKIKTITCHDVYNHGASLQAYALMTYLQQQGHNVEIIDYKPDYLSKHYRFKSIDNPIWEKNFIKKSIYLILKFPKRLIDLKRKKSFDKFRKKNLVLTHKRYKSNEELKFDLPDADVFICGSDQIWNTIHQNGRDKAFYLDFVPDNKIKASYAASFATDTIQAEYESFVKENIKCLNGIGVREASGVDIIKNLGIENSINVVDPVFLLDITKWNQLVIKEFNEKYLLVYDFDRNPFIEKLANEMRNLKGYKIYSINNYASGYEDKVFKYSGPDTFVSLVKNAQFIISNSYHAAVFSLLYNKQFIIINRTENINTRMRDLLLLVNLKNRLVSEESYSLEDIMSLINYEEVNKILEKQISISKDYLQSIMKIDNN